MNSRAKWLVVLGMTVLLLVTFGAVASAQDSQPAAQLAAPAFFDADSDGIDDAIETATGTNPNDPDSDNDGLCDGNVFPLTDTNGTVVLTDDHTCTGPEDVNVDGSVAAGLETDPRKVDTDGDNLCDGPNASAADSVIVGAFWAPGCRSTFGPTRGGEDKDGDGIVDAAPETDPRKIDTDGDKLPDGWIDGWDFNKLTGAGAGLTGTPNGVRERWEGEDLNLNGIPDGVPAETNPRIVDTDGDTMADWYEAHNLCLAPETDDRNNDGDGDGDPGPDGVFNTGDDVINLSNLQEWILRSDPCNQDTDGDKITDDWEYAYSNLNKDNFCPDLNGDGDGDGVMNMFADDGFRDYEPDAASNWTEFVGLNKTAPFVPFTLDPGDDSTSPCDSDTDGDRFLDGYEYWARFDPVNLAPATAVCTLTGIPGDAATVVRQFDPNDGPKAGLNTTGAAGDQFQAGFQPAGADPDLDELRNGSEYQGEDGITPSSSSIVALFPGDLIVTRGLPGDATKAKAWVADDPWFRFQPTGVGADATNPCNKDTDRGGVSDRLEVAEVDKDNDGSCTGWEENQDTDTACEKFWDINGWQMLPNWKLDDKLADHDYDGLGSLLESTTGTDWLNPDTDFDGLCDGNLQYVIDDPDGIYLAGTGLNFPTTLPPNPVVKITLNPGPPVYINPITLGIVVGAKDDGPEYYDLAESTGPGLPGDYICGGGEDLDRNGSVKGDLDPSEDLNGNGVLDAGEDRNGNGRLDLLGDEDWDVNEDRDGDGILDPWAPGPGPGEDLDGDGRLDKTTEVWTETNPRTPDTDRDGLCDGSVSSGPGAFSGLPLGIAVPGSPTLAELNNPMRCEPGEDLDDDANPADRGVRETDPLDSDTDDDHLYDYTEVVISCSDPLDSDTDDDNLYDGFFQRADSLLDVGVGPSDDPAPFGFVLGYWGAPNTPPLFQAVTWYAPNSIGFVPWFGFDGPNNKLNDDADVLVINDQNDDDQPGEDVEGTIYRQAVGGGVTFVGGDGVWDHTPGSLVAPLGPIFQETSACDFDSEKDGIWDGTEYASYEAPLYLNPIPPNTNPWNSTSDLMDDTDIDLQPITMAAEKDWLRPALDVDSDGDMLCDGDIKNAGNTGCRGANDALIDTNGDWIDDDSFSIALGARHGLYWLIGEDITDPEGTQGGIIDPTETDPMDWDTDGDRVDDGIEVVWYERFDCGNRVYRSDLNAWACDGGDRNALDSDSDSDGLPDGWIDFNGDGNRDKNEGEDFDLGAAPGLGDAFNGWILGDDGDRIWQVNPLDGGLPGGIFGGLMEENWGETDPLNVDTDGDHIWDGDEANSPLACLLGWNGDSDEDGLPDGWFDFDGTGPAVWKGEGVTRNPANWGIAASVNPAKLDAVIAGDDGTGKGGVKFPAMTNDGVVDYFEKWLETNPCNPDSDEDGVSDFVEVWGWEVGGLITYGWQEASPSGHLSDGPVAKPDVDNDGKLNAVDPNADGANRWPTMGSQLNPTGAYLYRGDSVCDSGLTFGAVVRHLPNQGNSIVRLGQRIMPGPDNFTEGALNQTYREVCDLHKITSQGTNPVFNANQWGEDTNVLWMNQGHPVLLSADGVIGYGGYYVGNPFWNAFEGGSKWVPPWPYQNVDNATTRPLPWNIYFQQSGPVFDLNAGLDDDSYDYPDAFGPINTTQTYLAVGDWDRDRKIDDNADGAYTVFGFDDIFVPQPPISTFKLIEDWNETDPLNADTDRDWVLDDAEVYAIYQGENTARAGFCNGSSRWGPLTDDQDFDLAKDGQEDVDLDGNYYSGLPLMSDVPTFGGTGTTSVKSPNSTGVETDPCKQDTDGDGLFDGKELEVGLDPADTDTNDDGKMDTLPQAPLACALDFNQNGIVDVEDIGFVASRWMDPAKYLAKYDIAPTLTGGVADGVIDIADIALIAVHWNEVCP